MSKSPLYNGQNLDFTGSENPYALIQKGGKRKTRKTRKARKARKTRKSRKMRK